MVSACAATANNKARIRKAIFFMGLQKGNNTAGPGTLDGLDAPKYPIPVRKVTPESLLTLKLLSLSQFYEFINESRAKPRKPNPRHSVAHPLPALDKLSE
jgi:hypothetical protein